MSANGAQVLGQLGQIGTVTVGKRADLVVIDGDPNRTPGDIRKVRWVFKDGIGYDAANLTASVKGLVGIR